ncbi:unnamed protein product [Spirodela intermedia]|uniref:Uncharacterized protein n=1 Tax=Spirodela intermedia TaxID=51605 RepID=A0A7I8LES4_SPIIN|nr:unnamed protein product [Spirodela intermedia]
MSLLFLIIYLDNYLQKLSLFGPLSISSLFCCENY